MKYDNCHTCEQDKHKQPLSMDSNSLEERALKVFPNLKVVKEIPDDLKENDVLRKSLGIDSNR